MKTISLAILIFLCITSKVIAQMTTDIALLNYRELVLMKAIPDSTFAFGKWSEKADEVRLTYLGAVTTDHGRTFKVMNSVWYWGLAHHATSRILIFDEHDRYVGDYNVAMVYHLPTTMKDGVLIFRNAADDCDIKIVTTVDLSHGLPSRFFRRCDNWSGVFLSFGGE